MADIVGRVKKLLALAANNSSPQEAAQAAAQAQELCFRYSIGEQDLDTGTQEDRTPEEIVNESVGHDSRRAVWKSSLANGLAKAFGCKMYSNHDDACHYRVVGIESAVQTVNYMFQYLVLEINRLTEEAWRSGQGSGSFTNPRTWKNSFRFGVVATIWNRLKEQIEAQKAVVAALQHQEEVRPNGQAPSTALALYSQDQARVAEHYGELKKKLGLRTTTSTTRRHNPSAYQQGQKAARDIVLGQHKGLVQGSKPRIGS